MDAVITKMINDPRKSTLVINMSRLGFHVEGVHLDSKIVDEVELNVEFCPQLPQHAWYFASDHFSLLSFAVKSFATGTIRDYSSNGLRTPERKKLIYAQRRRSSYQ